MPSGCVRHTRLARHLSALVPIRIAGHSRSLIFCAHLPDTQHTLSPRLHHLTTPRAYASRITRHAFLATRTRHTTRLAPFSPSVPRRTLPHTVCDVCLCVPAATSDTSDIKVSCLHPPEIFMDGGVRRATPHRPTVACLLCCSAWNVRTDATSPHYAEQFT